MSDDDILLSDDLSPNNSGSFFQPEVDEADAHEASEERARVTQAAPMIAELLSWFDAQIAGLDSIDGLDPGDTDVRSQIIGRQLAKVALEQSRVNLKNLGETYT